MGEAFHIQPYTKLPFLLSRIEIFETITHSLLCLKLANAAHINLGQKNEKISTPEMKEKFTILNTDVVGFLRMGKPKTGNSIRIKFSLSAQV